MRKLFTIAAVAAALAAAGTPSAQAAGAEGPPLMEKDWSWQGLLGTYDDAQLRRGFQVFNEICANCHSMDLVAYRNLEEIGFTPEEVKEIAAQREVEDGPNDMGEMFMRPAVPSDRFVPPFPNDKIAALANGGAVPPDLSLMTKARLGGPDYVYSLLMGYKDEIPEEALETMPEGKFYNEYFPGHWISMPPQIFDDMVAYEDGTEATAEQIATDVVAFLNWAAEPELEERHGMGIKVMIYLIVLTVLLYALKRQIWKDVH